jgi:hypothetical protein
MKTNQKNNRKAINMGVINAPEFIAGLGIVLTISAINQIGN